MKIILIVLFLLSFFSQVSIADSSQSLSVAYWSGCVRSRVQDLGMSKGKNAEFCTEMLKKQTFKKYTFEQILEIVEESRSLFYKGCIDGDAKNLDLHEKCHLLTKQYYKDLEDIVFSEE